MWKNLFVYSECVSLTRHNLIIIIKNRMANSQGGENMGDFQEKQKTWGGEESDKQELFSETWRKSLVL